MITTKQEMINKLVQQRASIIYEIGQACVYKREASSLIKAIEITDKTISEIAKTLK